MTMTSKITKAWQPGDFPMRESDWLLTQSDLQIAEEVMRELSSTTNWTVVGNIRTDWPARRLRRRRGLKVEEVRVLLSEPFELPEHRAYFVDRVSVVGLGPCRRERNHIRGARFSAAEVSDRALVRDRVLRMVESV